jgi:hypothetical protein
MYGGAGFLKTFTAFICVFLNASFWENEILIKGNNISFSVQQDISVLSCSIE